MDWEDTGGSPMGAGRPGVPVAGKGAEGIAGQAWTVPPCRMRISPVATCWNTVACFAAALAGLAAVWVGCGMANAPLQLGGPMNLSFAVPVGVPLVGLGIVGVALAPDRVRRLAQLCSAVLALATAGPNFWHGIPIEDGAFQSLRAGVPDPDTWPAPAFLHAVALAPVGVALAAVQPGPQRVVPLASWSVLAAIGAGVGLNAFADAVMRDGAGATLITLGVPATALLALSAVRGGSVAGRAVAGQAAVLLALCCVVWMECRWVA